MASNFNFNKVILGGKMVENPELRVTPQGINTTSFRIAVNRRGAGNNTDFFNVQAWRNTADFVTKYFRKGSSICVVGSIQNREWTDQNGQKRYATDIVADEAYFVDAKSDSQGTQPVQQNQDYMANQYQAMGQQVNQAAPQTAPMYEDITDSDELPF
ncbi:MAG: single-stranded DNA-binding protein [Clostridia bacterium]|nr:single-stranded DNA-binding protein [Clostridia bacterium]